METVTTAFDVLGEKEYTLSGGADDFTLTQAEIIAGYDYFADPETVQIDYLIMGGGGATETESKAKANKLISIVRETERTVLRLSLQINQMLLEYQTVLHRQLT